VKDAIVFLIETGVDDRPGKMTVPAKSGIRFLRPDECGDKTYIESIGIFFHEEVSGYLALLPTVMRRFESMIGDGEFGGSVVRFDVAY
jgi:hypothetical protein